MFELVCDHEMNFRAYDWIRNNSHDWVMKLLEKMSEFQDQDLHKSAREAGFIPLAENQSLITMLFTENEQNEAEG